MPVLADLYSQLEQSRGLPQGYLARTRAIESGNGTNLVNPRSSARGDFQFLKGTAAQFGINPMDPVQSATAAADLAAQNKAALQRAGITPTGADLYAAHQQGVGGYLKLAGGKSSGGAEMALNGGAGMAPSGFLSTIKAKFDNATPANLGGDAGQGPTMDNAAALAARQPMEGAQGPSLPAPAATAAPAAPAASPVYKGGLLGMLTGSEQPGSDKSVLDKLGDMSTGPGGGAIGGLLKGVGSLVAPAAPAQQAPVMAPPADGGVNVPNPALLGYLDPRRRRAAAMGIA